MRGVDWDAEEVSPQPGCESRGGASWALMETPTSNAALHMEDTLRAFGFFGVPGFGVPGFGVPGFGAPGFGVSGLSAWGLGSQGLGFGLVWGLGWFGVRV